MRSRTRKLTSATASDKRPRIISDPATDNFRPTTKVTTRASAAAATQLPPGATVGPAGFPVMPFSFAFNGSFFDLGDFFKRLDSFVTARNKQLSVTGRLLTVDSLQLAPGDTGFPKIKATVGGVAASVTGDPAVFVSVAAVHQGPSGGGPVAAIIRA